MKQIQLTDEEIKVTIGLLLSVRFVEIGDIALINAAAIVQRLKQAEEVKQDNVETIKPKSAKSKSA